MLTHHGTGLNRAECVLTHSSGVLLAADWTDTGGVSVISPDGWTGRVLAKPDRPLRPNGIALEASGSLLVAHLGEADGGLYRLFPDGTVEVVLLNVGGEPLPPTNYIHIDADGRFWVTVSTRHQPRAKAYRADIADGFIVLMDETGARIVADNLGYTNECLLSPDQRTLFVNETFARRTSAFDVAADGTLSNKRAMAHYGDGTYPDGVTLDQDGGLWITSIVSNRVIRVSANAEQQIVLDDGDAGHVAAVEAAYQSGVLDGPLLNSPKAQNPSLANVSSLAFGGADLKTAFIGTLAGPSIAAFDVSTAGLKPHHWTVPINAWLDAAAKNLVE